MIFRWWLALRSRRNRIWLGAAGSALLAVALALLAKVANRFVADGAVPAVPRETLDDLLTVIASSMLAVATFSLGVMVSAFASTASTATPRATELVMGDPGTRRAIASFVAAFIYAIVAKIALGMGYSIAAGVGARPDAGGWLILPGDMPMVRPATMLAVAAALEHHPVAYAQFQGRRGHPVGFAAELYSELMMLSGDEGARRIVARYPAIGVDVDDPGTLLDLDTEADLAAMRALAADEARPGAS